MQAADSFRHPLRQHVAPQRTLRRHARAFRNTVQVTVGQQPLCQRRKGHEPSPGLGIERQDARRVGFAVEQVVAILEKQAGYVALGQVAESETCRGQRVARQPDIERLACADDVDQSLEGLFERGLGIVAVRVEDVHIIELHAPQALVEACHEVFARAPVAVGPRPHVVTRLGRNEEFVAVGSERLLHQTAEVLLGRTVGRAVVVRQIEMDDSPVERVMGHLTHFGEGLLAAEIVPHAERKGGQQHTAASRTPVGHAIFVTRRGRLVNRFDHSCQFISVSKQKYPGTLYFSACLPGGCPSGTTVRIVAGAAPKKAAVASDITDTRH